LVTLIDTDRQIRVFRFLLSKQHATPYAGCWMTDAVREVGPEPTAPPLHGGPRAPKPEI
jgi:hypothetical protein